MVSRSSSLRTFPFLLVFWTGTVWGGPIPNIIVDQFGYRTASPKIVVFAQPSVGTGSPSSFTPGATFEVRRLSDSIVVFTGNTVQWSGGAVHSQSGDRAWQGAFTAYTTPGAYYISVPGGSNPGSQSYPFQIQDSVYNGVVTASQRSFFYQRCGTVIGAGHGGAWTHGLCHSAGNQDPFAHLWNGSDQGVGTARDLHGGWHDAGDYAKYITFVPGTLWYLMHSVEWYPLGYTDSTNIPESGNGVPDMLDEVKWELDWLLRMQRSSDGALYSMVGHVNGTGTQGDPVGETSTRYYTNVSTSATAVGAMAFSLGSRLLGAYPTYASYAVTLQNAAVSAWGYLAANPAPVNYNHTGIVNANANVGAATDLQLRVGAAAELFALTGNATYRTYFDSNYNSAAVMGPVSNPPTAGNAFSPDGSEALQLGMVSYCLAPGATGSVVSAIGNALKNECDWYMMGNNPGTSASGDPYMGFMWDGHYTWGSNQLKAAWGNQLLFAVKLGIGTSGERAAYLAQAEEYLHYFHGRNPLNWVYLTNMGPGGANLGASKTVRSIYHSWFWQGTTYDGNTGAGALGPAPGILVGGPNQFFAPDASYGGTISPPQGQPPMKAYKDWGNTWPENSWEVTENSQGYQGKYQFLLSAFAANAAPTATATPTATGTLATSTPTQTPTSSPTRTSSPTPTATTCLLLLNGGEALGENGTWSGTNAARSIEGAGTAPVGSITQGVSVLRANVTTAAGWNDQVFNLEGFAPTDWSQVTQVKMDIYVDASLRTGATYSQLFIRADSNPVTWYQPISNDTPSLGTGANLDVTFNINWAAGVLTSGMPITKLTFIYNNDSSVGTGSFWVDNVRLITSCAATPTSTPSRTSTPTSTPSPTRTSTASSTPTSTATPSASSTPSRTMTFTLTPDPSLTATLTFSPTNTHTIDDTPTSTRTSTFTSTHSPTFSPTLSPTAFPSVVVIANIGDYGDNNAPEADVALLVKGWNPDLITTNGDNNYDNGELSTIDDNIGQYYQEFIHPYLGSYGPGASINRFFPSLGNHDWDSGQSPGCQPYLDWFTLPAGPGNERYYEFSWGPVRFFMLDSDPREPDGITSSSSQALWLQTRLAAATECWKIVQMHHAPYSSCDSHGSTPALQWPYEVWGASAVIAGHDHVYERLQVGGIPYFVNGTGGRPLNGFDPPLPESQARFSADHGAMRITASPVSLIFEYFDRAGVLRDSHGLACMVPTATPTSSPTSTLTPTFTTTFTETASFSPTYTATLTFSPTYSLTPSHSPTMTQTPTSTPSSTRTPTPSPSPTPTLPATLTLTLTLTISPTPTGTASSTPSSTSSRTPTSTPTSTASFTATRTASASATATRSSTVSATPTFPSGAATPGPNPLVFSNPVPTGTLALLPQAYSGLSDVTVSLYTTAFKLVATKKFPSIPAGQIVTLDLVDQWGQPLGNGLYYLSVATRKDKKTVSLVVLR